MNRREPSELPSQSSVLPYSDAAAFARLARSRLLTEPACAPHTERSRSDYDLNPGTRRAGNPSLRPAAVLIPILLGSALRVLLTERTTHLAAHAGQIAFPGGKIEKNESPLAAALREAKEEVGLEAQFIEPLGYVEPYETVTGFFVTPVVAAIREGFTLAPDPEEVASVFEVPLAFLLDASNHRIETYSRRGVERRYYAMPYQGRYIWGATAGIIRALHGRLAAP